MISFDDFKKIELRIGKIVTAQKVEGADKLLKLEVDIGSEKRQMVAGVAHVYAPEDIIGKEIPIVINLEPRKIRGIESKGMLLAAVEDGKPVLLFPDKEVTPGTVIS